MSYVSVPSVYGLRSCVLLVLASLGLAACEDDPAAESLLCFLEPQSDGTQLLTCDNGFDHVMANGRDGADGTPGASALIDITPEPEGANCAAGGVRIAQTVDGASVGAPQFICNDVLGADVEALEIRIADLEAELAFYALAADLEPLTTEAEVQAMIDGLATETKATTDDLAARVDLLEPLTEEAVRLIDEDTVLNVPGDFATIHEAMDWLEGYVIARDVNVDIDLADGTYTFTEPLLFFHPYGNRIRVIGNPDNAAAVVLSFTGTSGIRTGRLGLLEGVTVRGDDTPMTNGIESTRGGFARLAADVVVENFGRSCVRAVFGAVVEADGATVRNCGEDGFAAHFSSAISAPGALAELNGRHGFSSAHGSGIYAENAISQDNVDSGFTAFASGGIWAEGADALRNDRFGFVSSVNGGITAQGGLAEGNGLSGFNSFAGSGLRADGATARNNTEFGFAAHASGGLSARGAQSYENGWHGFVSTNGSGIDADTATSRDNEGVGFEAWTNSGMTARNAVAQDNLNSGFNAAYSSAVWAEGADTLRNGIQDESEWGGGATAHGNSSLNLTDGLIQDNLEGVTIGAGYADVRGATIAGNEVYGVNPYFNGYVEITGATIGEGQIPPWYTPALDHGSANVIFDEDAPPPGAP